MASNQVLGKLRFDTSALDKQMQDVTNKLNAIKTAAASTLKANNLGQIKLDTSIIDAQIKTLKTQLTDLQTLAQSLTVGSALKATSSAIASATAAAAKASTRTSKSTSSADKNQVGLLRELKMYTADLTKAQREYIAAVKSGNTELQTYWNNSIKNASDLVKTVEGAASKTDTTTKTYERIRKGIDDATQQEKKFQDTLAETNRQLDERDQKKFDNQYVNQTRDAVKELKTVYQGYVQALKSGNEESVEYWQRQIDGAEQAVDALVKGAVKAPLSGDAQTKVLQYGVDAERAEVKFNDAVEKTNANLAKQANAADDNQKQMKQMVQQAERWLATMVVMRGLREVWRNASDYARQYYDAMNEIRIVTMMSQEEADALGAKYRQMAQDMSVSSTEIAKAAVEYWRQGLGAEEVENRLQYTTMYAKISAMDFAEAAELMTAATNSMGLSADRVADVWAYLGDASASGADEIGTAMQKVSAVAQTAGIEFEWLGAYIATLTEKTRQAPEAIGTALNSIISRLQQIKAKGFNSEDIYGINDIAKALGSLEQPIALMDEATGRWRDLPEILNDIAAQWQNLTDKEKAYIATTMGGTRQRNYLLTLLDDLSQASEDGSRAWKLYEGAMNAAGTAMEKYAIWEESVEAAQGRFNAQLEELYALIDGETIRGFYDVLATIVEFVNNAASAMDGWNIKLGLVAGGFALLVLAIRNVVIGYASLTATAATATAATTATGAAATAAAGGINLMNMALMATAAGLVIAGIATLVGYFISQGNAVSKATKNTEELADSLTSSNAKAGGISQAIDDLDRLASGYRGVTSDVDEFKAMRARLIDQYPELKNMIHLEVSDVDDLAAAYNELSDALDRASDKRLREQWTQAHAGYADAVKTLNEGRAQYTGVASAQSLYQLRSMNGDLFQTRVADSNLDQWGINQLREAKEQADAYVADMQDNLNRNWNLYSSETRDQMQKIIDDWIGYTDDLTAIIYDKTTEADKQIADSVRTLITNAINPDRNRDISGDIPHIIETLMGKDWVGKDGHIDVGYVETQVDVFLSAYRSAITKAENEVATMTSDFQANGSIGEEQIDGVIQSLRDASVSDAAIADILEPLFTAMGRTRDDLINRLLEGNGETTGDSGEPPEKTFEEKLQDAIAFIERLEDIQGVIADIVKDGSITKDVLDALSELFSPEMLEEMFEQAKDAAGELDLGEFVQILRDKMAEAQEDYEGTEGNLLLSALGYDEVTEEKVQEALDKIAKASSIDEIIKIWEGLPEKVKEAIGETGHEIEQMINDAANDADSAAERIEKSMQRIKRSMQLQDLETNNKVWSDLDDIMDDLTSTLDDAMGAIADIQGHMHDAGEAAGALQAAAAGDKDALEYLANATGLTAEMLANDLSPAEYLVAQMGDQASASQSFLADWLYQVGAINLDPTGKIVPIASIEEAANSCGMTVAALANALALFNGSSLTWSKTADGLGLRATARVPAIKWTGGTSSKKKSSGGGGSGKKGGGGGGGGGSGSDKVSELVETLVDEFSKLNELRDHRRELAQLGQGYHEARGEIQGVIAYLEMERSIVEEDTAALESYLASLEAQIEANREIVTTQAAGSKAYNQAMIDLDKLQEEHQKYSQQLIKNKTDVEKLTQAVKEQYDKIRQMEIDLRNTILEAIEDREKAEERKLNGRIEMEETILDLIKKRYEAERDQIIETQNLRKEALEDEINQIDELLEARKKLAEQEDKMAEIAALEEQIQRISADPTRQKEAMQLREKLAKLREDMAWDAAEAEAQAQKDSIKQQITSIDEYIDYVQKYYEDLFKHPQQLIEEMQEILTWTDDQIIAWLKANTEGYAEQTEATQRKMVNSWQSTLDDMRDTIRTHWEEVEQIIAGGADNIINFMTTYSQKYREAGKLQAEAYVDEWRKQLKDLENAYKQVNASIESYNYVATTKVNSSGGSGGGGGGASGGVGGGSATTQQTPKKTYYRWEYANTSGGWVTSTKNVINQSAFDGAKKKAMEYWSKYGGNMAPIILKELAAATMANPGRYLRQGASLYEYKTGGMSTATGLAWLDGTKQRPERILSAYQTELFEDMINTLHAIRRVNTGGMWTSAPRTSTASALPNIDSITINVQSLDSNADYEDGAEKLMNAFYEKIARTRPVGGIQGW